MLRASHVRLFQAFPLIALITLGCGSDDDAAAIDAGSEPGSDASSGAGPGSGADAASGSSASDAGGSAGGGFKDSGPASNPGLDASAADAGRDAAVMPDASSTLADAGSGQDAANTPDASGLAKFSFFVTSQTAIVSLSGDPKGFGGDLRYGETGAGAGLRGADKICAAIAERSMPGASAKQWRAFLSAAAGGASGGAVNARDRIGTGPWYDRKGRLVGNALADLISGNRPSQAAAEIQNDLPNETGTPNHAADGTAIDNHDTLTGSDTNGRFVSGANTCEDWTSSTASAGGGGGGGSGPSIGHSWPRSANNGMNWISDHKAGGCGKGINVGGGTSDGTATVGSGGGYGGFYCFALTP